MDRNCHNCKGSLSLEEAIEGTRWLFWMNHYPGHFEGWVNCRGEDSEFVQSDDKEFKKAIFEEICGLTEEEFTNYINLGLIVCKLCAISVFEEETGFSLKDHREV